MDTSIYTNSTQHPMLIYRECVNKNHANSGVDASGCTSFQSSADPNDLKCAFCGCGRGHHRQIVLAPGVTFNVSAMPAPPPPMSPKPVIANLSGGEYRKSFSQKRAKEGPGSGSRSGEGSSANLKMNEAQKKRATEFMEERGWQTVPAPELLQLCDEIGVPIKNFRWWVDRTKRRMKKSGELPK